MSKGGGQAMVTAATATGSGEPLLVVENLKKHFPIDGGMFDRNPKVVQAVDGVSFAIGHGETLSLVGESGSGKSTIGRCILRLIEPTEGAIRYEGVDLVPLSHGEMQPYRRKMQIIFQDPFSSLNPRMTAGEIVGEPLEVHGTASEAEIEERVAALFARVGLRPDQMTKYPHEFSGGQRQRIGIARSLALGPQLIVGDEPVSALDVSVQAQVINLLTDLQQEFGLSYLFIAHDLSVVRHISHRVAVMYLGRIVEIADCDALFENPQHPYTEALLSAVPRPDPRKARKARIILPGDIPSPVSPPSGCRFHTRCSLATDRCRSESPAFREVAPRHWAACHLR
ncbi:ABC transporter ATP-binding protein [Ferrovibrio sp.]|uniref:ABC transporter ATP-binding protein n=1 Tax=Ferrovibrio sp. TaxID=1917215 RepID=UPI003D0C0F93